MYELNKLCGEITKKLDNTAEYENWLIIQDYIDSFKQALNKIKTNIEDCKKLMPHEFDWGEQIDNILEEIDKVLGEDNEVTK